MSCLDELSVLAMTEGRLDRKAQAALEAHVDRCPDCRRLLAAVARGADPPDEPLAADQLEPGESCGRYLVLHRVGEGGMGVVYAAWDPELDRKVALKVVSDRATKDPRAQARLVREAKAMAAVSHPGVIAVFEVGRLEKQVYIAMEYMPGGTLGQWLLAPPKAPWRVTLRRFVAAGHGLAAAHRAGLVHRDFKPDNVLLGDDERVAVTDFGLALEPQTDDDETPTHGSTTAAAGTPAYMAPELLDGGSITARADQYSFCVALWEGLYGQRPFAGASARELLRASRERRWQATDEGDDVPPAVRQVLERGLDPQPHARYASMPALLASLERASRPRRRAGWVMAGAAALALIVAAVGLDRADPCEGGAQRWRQGWGEHQQDSLRTALQSTGAPFAADTFDRVRQALDRYGHDWASAWTAVCKSSADLASDPRAACLEHHRQQAYALVDALGRLDRTHVDLAVWEVIRLPRIQGCEQPWTYEYGAAAEVAAELELLDHLRRLDRPEVTPRLEDAARKAHELDDPALRARVATLRSAIAEQDGLRPVAHAHMREAGLHALRAGRPDLAIEAWTALAQFETRELDREWAGHYLGLAEAAADRLGTNTRYHVAIIGARGKAELTLAHFDEARFALSHAAAASERFWGRDDPRTLELQMRLASAMGQLEEHEHALALFESVLARQESVFGVVSRDVAWTRTRLAVTLATQDRPREAIAMYERTVEILVQLFGEDHAMPASVRAQMAQELMRFDPDRGLAMLRSALAVLEPDGGVTPYLIRRAIGHALAIGNRHEEAIDVLEVLLRDMGPRADSAHAGAQVHYLLGVSLAAVGRYDPAREHLREAASITSSAYGESHPRVWGAVAEEAFVSLLEGRPEIEPLERALEDDRVSPLWDAEARTRFHLAQALVAADQDRAYAATQAIAAHALATHANTLLAAEVAAWLGETFARGR